MKPAEQWANFSQRGGLWVLAQAALLSTLVLLSARFRSRGRQPIAIAAGATLLGTGAGIVAAGAIALAENLTPFPKPPEKAVLVRQGIFSMVRHPLYTGVMLMSVGWALIWRSPPALLMAFGLIPFFDSKARREERWLRERFPEYLDYERRVKRFLPGIY